jgi:hypothetical protein
LRNKSSHSKQRLKGKFLTITILLFLALLIIGGIDLYRKTFINWYVLLLPIFIGPLICIPKAKFLAGETNLKTAIILIYLYFMPVFFYLFLAINFYGNMGENKSENFKIVKKGDAFGGKRSVAKPFAIIIFNGKRKQLFFPVNERDAMYRSDNIKIEYRKGALQFYVLKHYDLN